ncbi:MAG: VIT1/CCC1 transporter family protein [Methanomassiliicoccales archaeon]
MEFLRNLKKALQAPETGPALRRYFVNTIFDSTFVILGVIIGSVFSADPSRQVVIATILTSSVALGISTGVSVYEAEKMEQERRMQEIESALLSSLKDTHIYRLSKVSTMLISLVNFSAPIMACAITLTPFLLLPEAELHTGGMISVTLALSILFVTGAMMGRMTQSNPLWKGTRMAIIGFLAFLLCYWIQSLV